jgi:hypothetical protein
MTRRELINRLKIGNLDDDIFLDVAGGTFSIVDVESQYIVAEDD